MTGETLGRQTLDVLVVGDLMADVLVAMSAPLARYSDTPSTISQRGGGSAANVAAWLGFLGVPTTYVGAIGDDAIGRAGLQLLADGGVRVAAVEVSGRGSGACVVLVDPDGQRSMLPDPGANDLLVPEDIRDSEFRPGRHLHLSGYTLLRHGSRGAGLSAIERARDAGMTVSVDPSSEALLIAAGAEAFRSWTAGVHLLLPNVDEARALAGRDSAAEAAAELAESYGEVVVTMGDSGAMWQHDFISATAPSEPPEHVVDTTGAGDAFTAGFLSTWLLHPEPETALAAGNRLAGLAISQVGARPERDAPPPDLTS